MDDIAVLDLSDHRSEESARRQDFARRLRTALCELGFVRIENHGIDAGLIRRVYAHFEKFFAQDEPRKLRHSGVAGGQRGFTPCGVDLFRALEDCAMGLLEALAESFDLPRDTFAAMLERGNSVLRALHYPPVPEAFDPGPVRAAAHEDINLITLLCGATDAGLEIRPPGSDEWIRVETPPGQIVADSGDMLSRLTNDLIPATTHRVVNPAEVAGRCRYSLPFFAHPRPDCDLSVLPRFVSADRPCRHASITAGGYLAERLREIGLVS